VDDRSFPGLDSAQQRRVRDWFPQARLVSDLSWPLADSTVLRVRTAIGDAIIKAGGPGNHHLPRELAAYQHWVGVLQQRGAAPALWRQDPDARVFATECLPGHLVQGHETDQDPETYRQAGALLAIFHRQASCVDADLGIAFNTERRQRAVRWLDGEHRIPPGTVNRLRALLEHHPSDPVMLVPTHGDYHPRNWMTHHGRLTVIDFGRAEWRPADTDLARLAAQQFRDRPDLERAFFDGYGSDPRGPDWAYVALTEAIATAAWSYLVGDERFESQGHRMIAESLELFR